MNDPQKVAIINTESDSFLEWCIENSFEVGEETKFTKWRLSKYLHSKAYIDNHRNKEIQISAFKKYVELNFTLRLVKWGIILFFLIQIKSLIL